MPLVTYEPLWIGWSRKELGEEVLTDHPPVSRHQTLAEYRAMDEIDLGVLPGHLGTCHTYRAEPERFPGGRLVKQRVGPWWCWTIFPPELAKSDE
jgi:hypothetical protein